MNVRESNKLLRSDMRTELQRLQAIRETWNGEAGKCALNDLDDIIRRLHRFIYGKR